MQNTQVINWSDSSLGSGSNRTDNHLVDWSPTMKLRWKKTVVFDDFSRTQNDELQQLWTDNLGEQEWRPIEFVE